MRNPSRRGDDEGLDVLSNEESIDFMLGAAAVISPPGASALNLFSEQRA